MGKSWRRDAKNDGWRKAKQQKQSKKQGKPVYYQEEPRPTDNSIGGINDYAYGM